MVYILCLNNQDFLIRSTWLFCWDKDYGQELFFISFWILQWSTLNENENPVAVVAITFAIVAIWAIKIVGNRLMQWIEDVTN